MATRDASVQTGLEVVPTSTKGRFVTLSGGYMTLASSEGAATGGLPPSISFGGRRPGQLVR